MNRLPNQTLQTGDGFLELTNSFTKSWDADNSGSIGAGESTWSKY
ncbi:hypothetical protein N9D72_04645 [Porticoccaceae bacterium]|nr:hypothetical protein [Porticoccaceae bacterium]